MSISTARIAYKIGLSSALNPDTISAYQEMMKWEFEGDDLARRGLVRAFGIGYRDGIKILQQVKYELKIKAQHA